MSKIEVNTVEPQCGTTLTVGASGDTIDTSNATLSTGGKTDLGTVNWDTTAKTAAFTAVSGKGYFVNTTSGAITVTLPASPSAGDIVAVKDYALTFATNNLTIGRNSSNINGVASNVTIDTNGASLVLVYVDGTKGWIPTQDDSSTIGALFVAATGGCITTCGNFKVHKFTGPGTFTVSCAGNSAGSNTVDYLVIAGGASGGVGNTAGGAGGGAGGLRVSSGTASGCWTASPLGSCVSALPVSAQGYPITVGGGGSAKGPGANGTAGNSGSNSVFSTITSAGGGAGAGHDAAGSTGGSGGGGTGAGPRAPESGYAGNTPPISPPQGQDGGNGGNLAPNYPSGGGGGAGGAAPDITNATSPGGAGGAGIQINICGSNYYWAGGGGGEGYGLPGGAGGIGGGGGGSASGTENGPQKCGGAAGGSAINSASAATPVNGGSGAPNSGGGGGGAVGGNPSMGGPGTSGAGGSGIVIIRYKFQ